MPENSLIPERYHILSGSALKVIALCCMILDHTAMMLIPRDGAVLFQLAGHTLTLYRAMRLIGRLAFPIFAFLLVEGFVHTHDRRKYGIRLFLFALISEIPWNLAISGSWHFARQNVFFTLFFGYLGMCLLEQLQKRDDDGEGWKAALLLIGAMLLSVLCRCDYGIRGFGFILMMYLLRSRPMERAILSCCILPGQWRAGLSAIPISLYNGERGFIRGKTMQLLFYALYPAQFLLLYVIRISVY